MKISTLLESILIYVMSWT